MKNTLLFICSTNILVRLLTVNMENCLTSKKSENVRPHYSQSSRENATPFSRTSPWASYKEVPPPPPPIHAELRRKKKRSKNSENIILIEADIQNLKFCRNTWLAFWTIVRLARISIKSRFFFFKLRLNNWVVERWLLGNPMQCVVLSTQFSRQSEAC